METGSLGALALVGVGGYAAYRVAKSPSLRHAVVVGVRGGEKLAAFSASTTLKLGAVVAAGAGVVAARSGGELLRAARFVDRVAA